jgi:hypothetical protein
VLLRCRSCGRDYPIEMFADAIDDILEKALADVSCNRL